jgi:hypothetical protein
MNRGSGWGYGVVAVWTEGSGVDHAVRAEEATAVEAAIPVFPFNEALADTAQNTGRQRLHHEMTGNFMFVEIMKFPGFRIFPSSGLCLGFLFWGCLAFGRRRRG